MKKSILLLVGFLLSIAGISQTHPVKIVFDVTSGDPSVHQSAMRHISVMSNQYPDSEFEMVIYSGAIDMVLNEKSTVSKNLKDLAKMDNVSFKVCQMSLDRHKINTSELIPGIGSVPDGILEIIMKQKEGWGYIKESK